MTYGWGPGEGDEGSGQWWSDEGVNLLMGVGQYDKARTAIYRVLEKDPADVRALCVLMRCQYALDEPSMQTAAEITRLDPAHGCAWIHRSLLYEDVEQWAEAESNAREAIRLDPQRVDAVTRLAVLLVAQPDRRKEALEVAREAVRLEPENTKALSILCYAALPLGKTKEAEKAIRAVLALEPENGWAMQRLAVIKVERGQYDEARRLLKAGVAADPTDEDLREAYESFERQFYGSPAREVLTTVSGLTWFGPLSDPDWRKAKQARIRGFVERSRLILRRLSS
ncbi:tetratricopeptide repeat protein [Kribbella sp. NPDC056861]|uniref:tetratricopeptide repeat protein n=1 Tax=Kribbella sp. NPDC056861 TaxID=3154857 RepID=UPI0034200249